MKNYKKKISMVLAFIMAITVVLGFNQEVKSDPINTDETVVVVPTHDPYDIEDFDVWKTYLGAEQGWFEGASGSFTNNTETAWTADLSAVGWGGVWGAYAKRTVIIKKNKEYSLSLSMKSSDVNKYVFIKIFNTTDGTISFADWIYLPSGETVKYNKTFIANEDANTIAFGFGGDYGDRTTNIDSDSAFRYRLLGANFRTLLKNDSDSDPTIGTKISCNDFNLVFTGNEVETLSNEVETTTKDIVVPTHDPYDIEDLDVWKTYLGAEQDWFEGASGSFTNNTETAWTADLSSVGWGGVWGAYAKRTVIIKKNKEYSLSLSMKSSDVNKYVFIKIFNTTNGTVSFADWIYLPAGENIEYNKTFVANKESDCLAFGFGGDYGDRDAEDAIDEDAAFRYHLLGNNYKALLQNDADSDPTQGTVISCTDFSLTYADNNTSGTTTAGDQTTSAGDQTTSATVVATTDEGVQITTNAVEGTTKGGQTTTGNVVTTTKSVPTAPATVAPTTEVVNVGTVKVKTFKRKKNSKKASIVLSKVNQASGYDVQLAAKKNFNKILIKKTFKKVSFTISSAKIKKQKTLYVRARAFIQKDGKKHLGAWSSIKKAK